MPTDQTHWRIAYPGNRVYHVIASSNINTNTSILFKLNSNLCKRFEKNGDEISAMGRLQEIVNPNGLATIFGFPNDEKMTFMHVFVKGGNAADAMKKMLELLDEKNSPQKHFIPIIKF